MHIEWPYNLCATKRTWSECIERNVKKSETEMDILWCNTQEYRQMPLIRGPILNWNKVHY